MATSRPLIDRLLNKVEFSDSGCWLWKGATVTGGYGLIGEGAPSTKLVLAHRAMWSILYGPIPEGAFICHSCDTPPCVAPDHLFLGTAQANFDDMVKKGRRRVMKKKDTCLRGHPYTEENSYIQNAPDGPHRSCLTCRRARDRRRRLGRL